MDLGHSPVIGLKKPGGYSRFRSLHPSAYGANRNPLATEDIHRAIPEHGQEKHPARRRGEARRRDC